MRERERERRGTDRFDLGNSKLRRAGTVPGVGHQERFGVQCAKSIGGVVLVG